MSLMRRRLLAAAAVLAFGGLAAPGHAATTTSQTRYVRDRFGRTSAAVVTIRTDHSAWRFVLPARLLDLPVAAQIDRLDAQFNLGADKDVVGQVLTSLQTARQQQAVQNNLDQINQINQQVQQQLDQINQMNQMQQQQEQIRQQIQQQQDQINRINQIQQPPFVPPPMPFIPPPGPPIGR